MQVSRPGQHWWRWAQRAQCLHVAVQAFTLRAWLAGLGEGERRSDALAAVWALMADGTLKPYSGADVFTQVSTCKALLYMPTKNTCC